jgi:hypothetical protein
MEQQYRLMSPMATSAVTSMQGRSSRAAVTHQNNEQRFSVSRKVIHVFFFEAPVVHIAWDRGLYLVARL